MRRGMRFPWPGWQAILLPLLLLLGARPTPAQPQHGGGAGDGERVAVVPMGQGTNSSPAAPAGEGAGRQISPAATNAPARVHVFVSGRVQGVGFRYFVSSKANGLGLTGWVRNLPDGRVELVAEGAAGRLADLLQVVALGPRGARVDKVERQTEPHSGEFRRFEITR